MKKFDILSAKVYFEDSKQFKNRPVLCLLDTGKYIISRKITSKDKRKNYPGEYRLKYWKEAGLKSPSTIRMSKHLRIPYDKVNYVIGHLTKSDEIEIQKLINTPYKESYNEDDDIDYILESFL